MEAKLRKEVEDYLLTTKLDPDSNPLDWYMDTACKTLFYIGLISSEVCICAFLLQALPVRVFSVPLVISLLTTKLFWPKFVIYHLHFVKLLSQYCGGNWAKSSLYTGISAINRFTDMGGGGVGNCPTLIFNYVCTYVLLYKVYHSTCVAFCTKADTRRESQEEGVL